MHYLVTGGCGFIGSHLIDLLVNDGHTVTVIDDLSTGKRENIPAGVRLITADITAPDVFTNIVTTVDGCFHLAAIVSVQKSSEEWLRTHQVNQSGTVALFDAIARSRRPIPVVYASSAATYGDCADIPLGESSSCNPLSAYGLDKLACEWQGRVAAGIHAIPSAGLRFFNVYGPRQDPASPYSGVISIFASRMKHNQPVTIFGDGGQTRDFIYVGDIVRGLFLAMQGLERKALICGVLNLCTGMETSVNELAQTIARITGTQSAITHAPARVGDIRISLGNPQAAREAIGFSAVTALKDGLELTLKEL
ncbi:MAG TPA: NAD-dependent epimerase/dehydratase family protein [Rickettsiales bacterium]|nr:NAD-dependent epimerase/dehydratase family protein [Rickettsiales bacterium]